MAESFQPGGLDAGFDLTEAQTSHARRLFLRGRRPDLYSAWLRRR